MKDITKLIEKESLEKKPLFILEMANNHQGKLDLGLEIIRQFHQVTKDFDYNFAFKFQYRDLDSFIHPEYKNRKDIKAIKRFSDTRLTEKDFLVMKQELEKLGFISICTPFDEISVRKIQEHNYDIMKIASCSLTDWPLLEEIVKTDKPIIASTGGASLEEIDRVFSFLKNRDKRFGMLHCVGEYPTENSRLNLDQIEFLQKRYPDIPIGFSTHEHPDNYDSIKIAIAKGARIFEKHVAIDEGRNAYSATPEQIKKWIEASKTALEMCGDTKISRVEASEKEKRDLTGFRRGVFVNKNIHVGDKIKREDLLFAIPNFPGQVLANDISKYVRYTAREEIPASSPLMLEKVDRQDIRGLIEKIVYKDVQKIIKESGIALPKTVNLELSHHYGIERFHEYGCSIISLINREYCKKYIVLLPGQENPFHLHQKKEESFIVDYGIISVNMKGYERNYEKGDIILVQRGFKHSFKSPTGGVFEEISTTHYPNDSFYDDEKITNNQDRKTLVKFRREF